MEEVLCRRFVCFVIEGCLKQAEGVDYQRLPLGCVFCYFFLRAEDCAEGLFYRLQLLSHDIVGLAITEDKELTITHYFLNKWNYQQIAFLAILAGVME